MLSLGWRGAVWYAQINQNVSYASRYLGLTPNNDYIIHNSSHFFLCGCAEICVSGLLLPVVGAPRFPDNFTVNERQ